MEAEACVAVGIMAGEETGAPLPHAGLAVLASHAALASFSETGTDRGAASGVDVSDCGAVAAVAEPAVLSSMAAPSFSSHAFATDCHASSISSSDRSCACAFAKCSALTAMAGLEKGFRGALRLVLSASSTVRSPAPLAGPSLICAAASHDHGS